MEITFKQQPNGRFKIVEEWFKITIMFQGRMKSFTLHRSCYKFKQDGNNIYPYLELETAIKKSKYLIRQWRHRGRR